MLKKQVASIMATLFALLELTLKMPIDMFTNESLHHIIYCARKELGLDQRHLANIIGTSQATFSRIEKGDKVLSVYQWSRLSKALNLPLEAVNFKYLDRKTLVTIRSQARENGFSLPTAYIKKRCLKVRFLLPILLYLCKESTEDDIYPTFSRLSVNPSFFYNLDNQVNLKFLDDLFNETRLKSLSQEDFKHIVKYFNQSESHGELFKDYRNAKGLFELLTLAVNSFNKYQQLFIYEIIESSSDYMILRIDKNFFLRRSFSSCQPVTTFFLDNYKIEVLKNLPSLHREESEERVSFEVLEKTENFSTYRLFAS